MHYSRTRRKRNIITTIIIIAVILAALFFLADYFNLIPKEYYTARDLHIDTLVSENDADGDGTDDYMDIMLGAREYVSTEPEYISSYYDGGYPPDGEGVCTDVIWYAFQNAGYDLKAMVDQDIAQYPEDYPEIETPDPNIDFRRVRNLKIFFDKYAESLTLDLTDTAAWQPGDIVIFDGHISIVSDKRTRSGRPYMIHHGGGMTQYEEDALNHAEILGHYRWNP